MNSVRDLVTRGPAHARRRERELRSFVRNRYFYGKLLDVHHLEMEQCYLNEKRWLLNRLGFGSGVLCGLDVDASDGIVRISPGVAIDGYGREIVVPDPFVLKDPFALTDDCGSPTGESAAELAHICIAFHECDAEPAPVLVSDCDVREECRPGATRERYRVLVHDGAASPAPWPCEREGTGGGHVETTGLTAGMRAAALGRPVGLMEVTEPSGDERRGLLGPQVGAWPAAGSQTNRLRLAFCRLLAGDCATPDEPCVPLATIWRDDDVILVEQCLSRTLVPSNVELLGLLGCLVEAMQRREPILEYVGGDGQTAKAGEAVDEPLVVRVVDAAGAPIENALVGFRARAGAGTVGADAASAGETYSGHADDQGEVSAVWKLGTEGLNTIEAAADGGSRVVFHAMAEGGQ